MLSGLVQTHPIEPRDEQFFCALVRERELFWANPKSLGLSKTDFDQQPFPQEDRTVAGANFRSLSELPSVCSALKKFAEDKGFHSNRSAMVYNPMSFMRWHTNSNAPGRRHYFTFTKGKAIFRWRHPVTGKIFDEIDRCGWTYRTFIISPTQPVWHTIWTEKVRLSFGFNSSVAAPMPIPEPAPLTADELRRAAYEADPIFFK